MHGIWPSVVNVAEEPQRRRGHSQRELQHGRPNQRDTLRQGQLLAVVVGRVGERQHVIGINGRVIEHVYGGLVQVQRCVFGRDHSVEREVPIRIVA